MVKYILKRTLYAFVTIILVTLILFFFKQIIPGDPVLSYLGLSEDTNYKIDDLSYKNARLKLGLDQPPFYITILPQYLDFKPSLKSNLAIDYEKKMHSRYDNDLLLGKFLNAYNEIQISPTLEEQLIQNLDTKGTIDSLTFLEGTQIVLFNKCLSILKELDQSKRAEIFTIPSIKWNGMKNQYHNWLFGNRRNSTGLLHGEFGISLIDGLKVQDKLWNSARWTFSLGFLSIILTLIIALPLGIMMGKYQNHRVSQFFDKGVILIYSIPTFWLSLLALSFLCNPDFLKIFPPGAGFMEVKPEDSIWYTLFQNIYYLILPALCWSSSIIAYLIIQIKESTIKIKESYHYRTALARGLKQQNIIFRHLLLNLSAIIISFIPSIFVIFLTGSVIIESIFTVPGIGKLMLTSIYSQDYPVVLGITVFISFLNVIITLCADILLVWLDPRIKLSKV